MTTPPIKAVAEFVSQVAHSRTARWSALKRHPLALGWLPILWVMAFTHAVFAEPIDRHALVSRHDPVVERFDPESPLSLGNGQFAFTADVTGLQTFPEAYDATIPLCTLSHWGWHTAPNPNGWSIEKFKFTEFDSGGRKVPYADIPGDVRTPEVQWLRANPHRLHLGRLGFRFTKPDGQVAVPADVTDVRQHLRLWEGALESRYKLDGKPVEVETVCHPTLDLVAVRVRSPLVSKGEISIEMKFPYGTGEFKTADWDHPEAHQTTLTQPEPNAARFARTLDADQYEVAAGWSPGGTLEKVGPHHFVLSFAPKSSSFEFVCQFSPAVPQTALPTFDETLEAARKHWHDFWTTGGAIDLSGSRDHRWRELERRIVLSQYLTAIQCAGDLPPQESGLTFNSWEGKFHLEMHWWHGVHFALWNRWPLFERSLDYYRRILPKAQATARRQGYTGARWPKMTGPTGDESPSTIGPFLIWQQPHPIYFAELAYRRNPTRATLEKYGEVVMETAEFMVSYPMWKEFPKSEPNFRKPVDWLPKGRPRPHTPVDPFSPRGTYNLGPVLQSAQERFPKSHTLNPTFELAYWRLTLEIARHWRSRLGLPPDDRWDHVHRNFASFRVVDHKYAFAETALDSYTNPRWNDDHPAVLGAFGMLPAGAIEDSWMHLTFLWIWKNWNWESTWGWDYPLVAMCAARLDQPALAVDALLLDTPKNHYRFNGHNHQREGLTVYLPGNGGLLTAAAMMAAGWDGAPKKHAPGFPDDGTWTVRWENLRPLP